MVDVLVNNAGGSVRAKVVGVAMGTLRVTGTGSTLAAFEQHGCRVLEQHRHAHRLGITACHHAPATITT